MARLALLDEARAAGLEVVADGDELVVRGPRRLADLVKLVLASKAELLAILREAEAPAAEPAEPSPTSAVRVRRLIGNGFPSIPTTIPPDSIVAKPRAVCKVCDQGTVLPELRELTGGSCYRCWMQSNSPAARCSPQTRADDPVVISAKDVSTGR